MPRAISRMAEVDMVVVLVVVLVSKSGQFLQLSQILFSHISECQASGGLLVDKLAESCLALDEAVRHVFGLAQSGQPHHEFDWVNIVGNHNQFGLLLLDQSGHVIETALYELWLFAFVSFLGHCGLFGCFEEPCLFFGR